ncbi:hypothetical protein FOZ62_017436, partial [Perkinsus olseni]
ERLSSEMLELLLSRTKADPDSVGALHGAAARRFSCKDSKAMLVHGGAFSWRASAKTRRVADYDDDDAVERTCEMLVQTATVEYIVEELELAVKYTDRLCAK